MEKRMVMKATLFLFFALHLCSLSAQDPCTGCWGITSTPVLSDSDRVALRLYKSEAALKWHDFKTYKFKGQGKRAVWIGYVAAGILHGGREAYQADRTIFEKRLGVSPTSFFGSEQWVRQYKNHDPEQPHKINLFNGFRDYWHMSGATTKYILVTGAFTIGASKQSIKYRVLDALIAIGVRSAAASLTYNLLR